MKVCLDRLVLFLSRCSNIVFVKSRESAFGVFAIFLLACFKSGLVTKLTLHLFFVGVSEADL
jgi:hypothetical protein